MHSNVRYVYSRIRASAYGGIVLLYKRGATGTWIDAIWPIHTLSSSGIAVYWNSVQVLASLSVNAVQDSRATRIKQIPPSAETHTHTHTPNALSTIIHVIQKVYSGERDDDGLRTPHMVTSSELRIIDRDLIQSPYATLHEIKPELS